MALQFIGIDPATEDDKCPAVFVDDATGDFVFQGWTVTDSADLADVTTRSSIATGEAVVRLPARMRDIIARALEAHDDRTQQARPGDGDGVR